jgi:V8-like Glu-specific endopeptidase
MSELSITPGQQPETVPATTEWFDEGPFAAASGPLPQTEARFGAEPGMETPFLDHEPSQGQRTPRFELEEPGIIDGDNRIRVKDTTGVPWRWICKIDVADSQGRPAGSGTGLLISNRHILTAAHVVYDAYKNMQQYTITVIPALDDLDEPFDRYALSAKPWIRQEYDPTAADSPEWDYALLTLGSAVGGRRFKALSDEPLCFWGSPQCGESTVLARLDPGALNGKAAYTAGYPAGKGGRQLWCAAGILHTVHEKRRTMYTTAETTRGQSGSPVWVVDNKRHCLVGIAVGAGTGSNRIVRVTRELVRQLRAWITEGGETPAMEVTEEALEPPVLLLPEPEAPSPDAQPWLERFDPAAVPHDVAAALAKQDWPAALRLVIQGGCRDENELTNLVFFTRHPELSAEPLKRDDPNFGRLSAEWTKILDREVWKAIEVSAENTDLVVSGEEVTDHHRAFFQGQSGRRLKKLVEDAASQAGLNPGLLGTIMMAETRRPLSYLSGEKVSSYHIGCDDFYEGRAGIQARVPADADRAPQRCREGSPDGQDHPVRLWSRRRAGHRGLPQVPGGPSQGDRRRTARRLRQPPPPYQVRAHPDGDGCRDRRGHTVSQGCTQRRGHLRPGGDTGTGISDQAQCHGPDGAGHAPVRLGLWRPRGAGDQAGGT